MTHSFLSTVLYHTFLLHSAFCIWGYRTWIRIFGWIGNMVLAEMIDHSQVDFSYIYIILPKCTYCFILVQSKILSLLYYLHGLSHICSLIFESKNSVILGMVPLAYSSTWYSLQWQTLILWIMYVYYLHIYIVNKWVTWYVSYTTT